MANPENGQLYFLNDSNFQTVAAAAFPALWKEEHDWDQTPDRHFSRMHLFEWEDLDPLNSKTHADIYDVVLRLAREGKLTEPIGFVFYSKIAVNDIKRLIAFFEYMHDYLLTVHQPVDLSQFSFEIGNIDLNAHPDDPRFAMTCPILWVKPIQDNQY